jgi:hypothetical protein
MFLDKTFVGIFHLPYACQRSSYLIFLILIALIMFGEEFKLWSSALCTFLHHPVTSSLSLSLSRTHIFSSALHNQAPSICVPPLGWKTATGRNIVLYILIFKKSFHVQNIWKVNSNFRWILVTINEGLVKNLKIWYLAFRCSWILDFKFVDFSYVSWEWNKTCFMPCKEEIQSCACDCSSGTRWRVIDWLWKILKKFLEVLQGNCTPVN